MNIFDSIKKKLYKNALISEKANKLSNEERQAIVLKLLEDKSERQLGEELGIPHSTIHDWKTLRQINKAELTHISLSSIIRKLKDYKPEGWEEWEQIKVIKKIVTEKLKEEKEKNDMSKM